MSGQIESMEPLPLLPPMVTFAEGGPCGKGETAAKTGCTPAGGDGGGKDAPKEPSGGGPSIGAEDLAHFLDPQSESTQGYVNKANSTLERIRHGVREDELTLDESISKVLDGGSWGSGMKKVIEEKARATMDWGSDESLQEVEDSEDLDLFRLEGKRKSEDTFASDAHGILKWDGEMWTDMAAEGEKEFHGNLRSGPLSESTTGEPRYEYGSREPADDEGEGEDPYEWGSREP